jgi:uncharacterized tellurite resistance protein B-like protein
MPEVTRRLKKILKLTPDEIYHVFCLALCVSAVDGEMTDREGEALTRLGFGLGLSPEDIEMLTKNAKEAVRETSAADVIAYSAACLKQTLSGEQLEGVKQILKYVARSDRRVPDVEKALLDVLNDTWKK